LQLPLHNGNGERQQQQQQQQQQQEQMLNLSTSGETAENKVHFAMGGIIDIAS
jgi:hypothetical protein